MSKIPTNTDYQYIYDIVKIIDQNEYLIEYDYKGKKDQILVKKELIDKTLLYCKRIKDSEDIDFTNLVKLSIRESFELLEHDLVLSKSGNIFIKMVDKIEKDSGGNSAYYRFGGFRERDMKSFYNEFFTDIKNKEIFSSIARNFVNVYFNNKKITNDAYEKNAVAHLYNMMLERLISECENDNDNGFIKGFAGYVFRIHFREVFEFVADALLNEISMRNEHVVEFLNYYSSDVIVLDGEKYKVPIIKAKDGLRWNVVSMLSVAKIYTKTEKSIETLKTKKLELENEISELYIDDLSPIEYNKLYIKKRQKIEAKIYETGKKLNRYKNSLNATKGEKQINSLKQEVKNIENTIINSKKEKDLLTEKMCKPSVLKKYQELQVNMDSLTRQLNNKQKLITRNINAYLSMRNSLAKALMSKKKLMQSGC